MIEINESDVESILNKLESLTASNCKFQILIDKPDEKDREEMYSEYNYTRHTIKEKTDELTKQGLLKEKDGKINCTQRGSNIADSLLDLYQDFVIDNRIRPFFKNIECEEKYEPNVEYFSADVEFVREKDDLDLSVKNHYKKRLQQSDALRELLPFPLGLRPETEKNILSDDEFDVEYILSDDFLSDIKDNTHYQERMFDYATEGGATWFVSDSVPYMMSIFDKYVIFISDDGRLKVALESENGEVLKWANNIYENIREESDKIDISKSDEDIKITRLNE